MTHSGQVQSKLNIENWDGIDWKQTEKTVFRLQKRIYKASKNGNSKAVRKLQKLLQRSTAAKLLAVRKVTQDNQGKRTAGVDGVKSLSPKKRLELVKELNINSRKVKPTRRVFIPQANGKLRPLGIPTMYDRALQTLVKLVLEPEWEARFEPNNFGYRPSRGCQDAIEAIFSKIYMKKKYILDADISGCFDNINHIALLDKINTYPNLRKQIKSWLKAGCITNGVFEHTNKGTPQGGTLSPLLANIALHGMEEKLKEFAATFKGQKSKNISSLGIVRYADDFAVFHPDLKVIQECKKIISEWLKGIGLELNEDKTRIVHSTEGFDFLGFNIKQYDVGKRKSGKDCRKRPLGYKTSIRPSNDSMKKHYDQLAKICKKFQDSTQGTLINKLNPIILGWSNYFSSAVSSKAFKKLDYLVWRRIWRWCKRRHPKKSSKWVKEKYFRKIGNRNWVFSDGENTLRLHSDTKIIRHIKIKADKSPYDGDFPYWARRMSNYPQASMRVSKLLKKHKGICNQCGLYFMSNQIAEVDHIIPVVMGGKDTYTNLQLLHKHCHDFKSQNDGSHSRQKRIELLSSPIGN